jgi:predicted NBD/HSP70 family sugar kinase
LLFVQTRGRLAVAVDVRAVTTSIALADFSGRMLTREAFDTPSTPEALVEELAARVSRMAPARSDILDHEEDCEGLGVVVPGMVDRRTGRILYAPRLGWRDVDIRSALAARLGVSVSVESAPIACAMARLWLAPEATRVVRSFAYVSVSEGVGVGLVDNGEVLRGEAHTAGEFGHVSLDPAGPSCVCGKRGCWEALVCNSATVARYVEGVRGTRESNDAAQLAGRRTLTIAEVVRRARRGEPAAVEAVAETGRQIGRGLAAVVSAFNPGRVYLGGEITAAWEIIEPMIRQSLVAETLTDAARATPVVPDENPAEYRLLGAVALVAAPTFAAPNIG